MSPQGNKRKVDGLCDCVGINNGLIRKGRYQIFYRKKKAFPERMLLVAPSLPTSNQILEDLKTMGDFK